jgi:molybdopterin adenylyltransferase
MSPDTTNAIDLLTPARIRILVVSDRASVGLYEDLGGPAIRAELGRTLVSRWEAVFRLVPDEIPLIVDALVALCDEEKCSLVITTGGTGPAPRDVTPEATAMVVDKLMPGFGELMRSASLAKVPTAILSRQTAGIRGRSLIINMPGKPAAIRDCLAAVFPAIPYCLDLVGGSHLETDPAVCLAFRPKQAGARVP